MCLGSVKCDYNKKLVINCCYLNFNFSLIRGIDSEDVYCELFIFCWYLNYSVVLTGIDDIDFFC